MAIQHFPPVFLSEESIFFFFLFGYILLQLGMSVKTEEQNGSVDPYEMSYQ